MSLEVIFFLYLHTSCDYDINSILMTEPVCIETGCVLCTKTSIFVHNFDSRNVGENFHGLSDVCLMGFIYSLLICEIYQTFGSGRQKCPTFFPYAVLMLQ